MKEKEKEKGTGVEIVIDPRIDEKRREIAGTVIPTTLNATVNDFAEKETIGIGIMKNVMKITNLDVITTDIMIMVVIATTGKLIAGRTMR